MILGGDRRRIAYRPCGTCLVNVACQPHDPGGETCRMLAEERAAKFQPSPGEDD